MKSVAFLVCSGIGYLIGHYFGDGALATYASVLISYHLYLGFLVVTAEKESGLSLPIGPTILTHAACLALVVALAIGRHQIPFFAVVRLFIPGIAPFEANWLFSGGKKEAETVKSPSPFARLAAFIREGSPSSPQGGAHPASAPKAAAAPAGSLFETSTAEDYSEFLKLMQQGKRPFRRPGLSVKDEFELWLAAKAHAAESANSQTA
jgi:hypothetical protein